MSSGVNRLAIRETTLKGGDMKMLEAEIKKSAGGFHVKHVSKVGNKKK
jgi:hypothetical protein